MLVLGRMSTRPQRARMHPEDAELRDLVRRKASVRNERQRPPTLEHPKMWRTEAGGLDG